MKNFYLNLSQVIRHSLYKVIITGLLLIIILYLSLIHESLGELKEETVNVSNGIKVEIVDDSIFPTPPGLPKIER